MISVVVPCYNAAATLAETVESALAQDVEKQIIVVDDGSTDGSAAVIAGFGDKVRAIATPNRGASAARQTGAELARGDFIQYLDSDDLLAEGTLARRLEALERDGGDVAHTDWQRLEPDGAGGFEFGEIRRPDAGPRSRPTPRRQRPPASSGPRPPHCFIPEPSCSASGPGPRTCR